MLKACCAQKAAIVCSKTSTLILLVLLCLPTEIHCCEVCDLQQSPGTVFEITGCWFQVELFKATMARKAAQFLEGQMVEKVARDTQIAALYTNEPKPEYFMQFGTSHR